MKIIYKINKNKEVTLHTNSSLTKSLATKRERERRYERERERERRRECAQTNGVFLRNTHS